MILPRGTLVLTQLDPTLGHEQRGVRPCVIVSDPSVTQHQRFPLVVVVPVTGTAGFGALYPELSTGESGLVKTSYALVDHVRSVDKQRIVRVFGRISLDEIDAIDRGLQLLLGINLIDIFD